MALDQNILEILCCPECKGELKQKDESLECGACNLAFAVDDGMPCLLVGEAAKLS